MELTSEMLILESCSSGLADISRSLTYQEAMYVLYLLVVGERTEENATHPRYDYNRSVREPVIVDSMNKNEYTLARPNC